MCANKYSSLAYQYISLTSYYFIFRCHKQQGSVNCDIVTILWVAELNHLSSKLLLCRRKSGYTRGCLRVSLIDYDNTGVNFCQIFNFLSNSTFYYNSQCEHSFFLIYFLSLTLTLNKLIFLGKYQRSYTLRRKG